VAAAGGGPAAPASGLACAGGRT